MDYVRSHVEPVCTSSTMSNPQHPHRHKHTAWAKQRKWGFLKKGILFFWDGLPIHVTFMCAHSDKQYKYLITPKTP